MVYSFKGMTWHEPHILHPMISMLQVAQTKIWCYGPETDGANLVVDSTVGVQYLIEIKDAMGFFGDDWLWAECMASCFGSLLLFWEENAAIFVISSLGDKGALWTLFGHPCGNRKGFVWILSDPSIHFLLFEIQV